jgi:hypothetical protein
MTPEEINKTIDFLIQHAATFSAQMDELKLRQEEFAKRQEQDHKFILDLAKSTAQFQAWATEVVSIESRRLDEHDRLHRDLLSLLHRIFDRLPPV